MIGRTVGSYAIERRLGAGGMGTVYLARHTVMGRRAAVKLLKPEHTRNPETVQRFFNEARAAAAIEHPGIVEVLDVGTTGEGEAFLVMELLEGESLAARLERLGALPPETVVRLVRQIAVALAAAHARGIVHRDLKPDNVFIVPDPETTSGERIKLLDFGIAKLHGELAADAPITTTGAVFGTPIYMSPEQCRGAEAVDHRADLYALGCIAFHALLGRPPFRAPGLGDLLAKHMFEPPMSPRTLLPSVPEQLDAIVLCLLAKSPAERFQSATALIAALDGAPAPLDARVSADLATASPGTPLALAETAATLDPPPTQMRTSTLGGAAAQVASPPPARRPWGWIAAAAIAAVAAAAVAVVVVSQRDDDQAPASSDKLDVPAIELTPPALGLKFVDDYAKATGAGLVTYASPAAWDAAARDFEIAAAQHGAPARWQAGALGAAGEAAMLRGDHVGAAARITEASVLAPDWPWLQVALASARTHTGDPEGAIAAAREAQRLAPAWWMAVAAEARVHRHADQLDLAIEQYRRALPLAPDEPALLAELALIYHAARLDEDAERYALRALALDPEVTSARLILAERALERGDAKTALAEAERLIAINPRSATGQLARADALLALGRKDEALAGFQKVVEIEASTDQGSVPPQRLAEVRAALAHDKQAALAELAKQRASKRSRRDRAKKEHKGIKLPRCADDPLGCRSKHGGDDDLLDPL